MTRLVWLDPLKLKMQSNERDAAQHSTSFCEHQKQDLTVSDILKTKLTSQ